MKTAETMWDVIIVGSGPASLAAIHGLEGFTGSILVIDGGMAPDDASLEWQKSTKDAIVRGGVPPTDYRPTYGLKDTPLKTWFGSSFAQDGHSAITIKTHGDAGYRPSFAIGGLSNTWGGNCEEFLTRDLEDWPEDVRQLADHYPQVRSVLGVDKSTSDDFRVNPLFERMLASRSNRPSRNSTGLHRTRVAVRHGVDDFCRSCGLCLSGCPIDAIFSTREWFAAVAPPGITLLIGHLATSIMELDDSVEVRCVRNDQESMTFRCRRLLIAAGPLVSTALALTALPDGTRATLEDCQAFSLPFFSLRSLRSTRRHVALAHIATTFTSGDGRSRGYAQFYDNNEEIRQIVRGVTRSLRLPAFVARFLSNHLFAGHGFLSSADSGRIEVSIETVSSANLTIRVENRVRRSTKTSMQWVIRRMTRLFLPHGIVPLFPLAHAEPVGRSYHIGTATFHGENGNSSSDGMGCPPGLSLVHLVDASGLPSMPPQSPTATIMANAMRIASSIRM